MTVTAPLHPSGSRTTHYTASTAALAVTALLLLLPPASGSPRPAVSPSGEWLQFHGDAGLDGVSGSGESPVNVTLFPAVSLSKYASFGAIADNGFPYQASPVTDGSSLFVALGNYVVGLSASSGTLLPGWQDVALTGGVDAGPILATPDLHDGTLYVEQASTGGVGSSALIAVNPLNGSAEWAKAPEADCGYSCRALSSPAVGAGNVSFATAGGELFSYGLLAGASIVPGLGAVDGAEYTATPDFVFIAGLDESAFVLPSEDPLNAKLEAFTLAPTPGEVVGFPTAPSTGYGEILTSSAAVVNLTAGSTTDTWAFFGGDAGVDVASTVWAIDLSDPSITASLAIPTEGDTADTVDATPVVSVVPGEPGRATLYLATTDDQVVNASFDWAGGASTYFSLGWKFVTSGPVYASPALDGNALIVPSTNADGTVYALYANNGTRDWEETTGAPVYASPAASGGAVYVVNSAGDLYAFGSAPGGGSPGGGSAASGPGSDLVYALVAVVVVVAVLVAVVAILLGRRRHARLPPPTMAPAPGASGTPPPPSSTWAPYPSPTPPPGAGGYPPPPSPPYSYPPPPTSSPAPSAPPPFSGTMNGVPGASPPKGVPPPPTTAEVSYDEPE